MAVTEESPAPARSETRVIVFASGLGVGRTVNNTRLIARLSDGSRVTLPVEFVGQTSTPGIYQIIFRTESALAGQTRVLLAVEGNDEAWVSLPLR